MTDAEAMALLTEIPLTRQDAGMRRLIADMEQDGLHATFFEVAGFPEPAPVIVINHVAPRPSMAAIREAYRQLRQRAAKTEAHA